MATALSGGWPSQLQLNSSELAGTYPTTWPVNVAGIAGNATVYSPPGARSAVSTPPHQPASTAGSVNAASARPGGQAPSRTSARITGLSSLISIPFSPMPASSATG